MRKLIIIPLLLFAVSAIAQKPISTSKLRITSTPALLDTAANVLVWDFDNGEVKRRKLSLMSGFFPLAGSATATDDVVIDGDGNELSLNFYAINQSTSASVKFYTTIWGDNTSTATIVPANTNMDKDVFAPFEDAVATITFTVHGIASDGATAYSCKKEATFRKHETDNPTAVGTVTTIFEKEDVSGTATAISVSGNNIRLTATTPVDTSIHWTAYATVMVTQYQ